ncbi:MAG: Vancomycin B-type resistance protein VanW [Acidimicrobiales bacterium]|nr:Vancomycin B-type resistance protein VanW [Acidimicrobiales bacterium]
MATRRTRVLLGIGTPVLVVLLVLGAWAIDTGSASGKVPRNVKLAGRDIGRLAEDRLAITVRDIAAQYAKVPVQVRIPGRTYVISAEALGLMLDEDATIQATLALDDGKALPVRPLVWLGSFAAARTAPLIFTVRDDALAAGLAGLQGPGAVAVAEPSLVNTSAGIGIISGHSGRSIDAGTVKTQLLRRAASGELPIVVITTTVNRDPSVSNERARAVADEVNFKTSHGLLVKAGGQQALLSPSTVRSWLGSKPGPKGLELTLDSKRAVSDVKAALPAPTTAKDAQFQVTPPTVTIVPSQDGTVCCAADSPARLLAAITAGAPQADIALQVDHPAFTTEAAQKLGIKEAVGTTVMWNNQAQVKSFTTYYQGGQPRVINIHRIADKVRGAIIKPGETFSLNAQVGPRTVTDGFVLAGAIRDGQHADEVGGGVSQFSTTLFNAAFFAGLDIVSHQAHSIYFPRYPFGREATLGFPDPDQKITNNTPYGVLIWTSYTDTSVTVTMYSTQNVYGEQTSQTTAKSGACDVVTTGRTRHYADGHTTTDKFRAVYRPDYGVKCG